MPLRFRFQIARHRAAAAALWMRAALLCRLGLHSRVAVVQYDELHRAGWWMRRRNCRCCGALLRSDQLWCTEVPAHVRG